MGHSYQRRFPNLQGRDPEMQIETTILCLVDLPYRETLEEIRWLLEKALGKRERMKKKWNREGREIFSLVEYKKLECLEQFIRLLVGLRRDIGVKVSEVQAEMQPCTSDPSEVHTQQL